MSVKKPQNPVTKSSEAISGQDHYASGPYALPEPRVLRGGNWRYNPYYLESATRGGNPPSRRSNRIGFRISRTVGKTERK